MDPTLLKDLNDFKKRSISQPTVESKRAKSKANSSDTKKKSSKSKHNDLPKELLQPKKASSSSSFDYKQRPFRNKHRFAVLAAIVDFMKKRHLSRRVEALSLDEILDQIKYTDISQSDKLWLRNEALTVNAKLVHKEGKFTFKPKYYIKDKKQLVRLLERHQDKGMGGILLDEIRESLPDADELVKAVRKRITFITRPADKKVVLFFKNDQYNITVEEEFQQHWRSISVDGIGEADIDKYLVNAGIATMQNYGLQRQQTPQRKKANKRKKVFKKLNVHLDESTLKDYSQI